jgi:uncharacterized protein (PEP-CTERM system associated)
MCPINRLTSLLWAVHFSCLAAASSLAQAQDDASEAPRRLFSVTPSVFVEEIFTDNHRFVGTGKESDAITRSVAGLQLRSRSPRLSGFLDYSLAALHYARHSDLDERQNNLNAAASAELIERLVFLDVAGWIGREPLSVFGRRPSDLNLADPNLAEVRSFSLTPRLEGRVASFAEYEARWSHVTTTTEASDAFDTTGDTASLRISSDRKATVMTWAVDARKETVDIEQGRDTDETQVRGTVTASPDGELAASAIIGRETSDLLEGERRRHTVAGWRLAWVPSPRTRFSAERVSRFFGHSHAVHLAHRTARWAWIYTDTSDLTVGYEPVFGNRGASYDLIFQHFANTEPDPVRREALVSSFLESHALVETVEPFTTGLLSTSAARARHQRLSLAWLGARAVFVLTALQTEARRLATLGPVTDDFTLTDHIRQRGVGLNLSHRLTPLTSAAIVALWRRTGGDTAIQGSKFKSVVLSWSTRLSRRTSAAVGARYAAFDNADAPYDERAVIANLRVQF